MKAVSIVVPTLNESKNVSVLVRRIARSFQRSGVSYEVIFIDDHSTDGTTLEIQKLARTYPVRLHTKKGQQGKAYSLLEGFKLAKYNIICMIDADLQYPPESILPMYQLLIQADVDVVVTERIDDASTSKFRHFSSKVFNFVFTRLLFGFNYDTQSGLKLFRKEVITAISLNPTPWSFDLEFIVRALEKNYKVLSHQITFSKRHSGKAKVRILRVTYELVVASLKLRLNSSRRKIKLAYHSSLEVANKMLGIFILIAAVAGYGLVYPLHADALIPETTTAQLQLQPDSTNRLFPDMLRLQPPSRAADSSANQSSDSPTKPTANQDIPTTSVRPDTAQPQLIARQQSARTSLNNQAELAGSTYPRVASAPTTVYNSPPSPLPYDLTRLWTVSFIAIVIIAAAYEIVTSRRIRQVRNTGGVQ